jgi:hypothetical protein
MSARPLGVGLTLLTTTASRKCIAVHEKLLTRSDGESGRRVASPGRAPSEPPHAFVTVTATSMPSPTVPVKPVAGP